ncbi:MAG TPA: aromatic-ring-hydroxylating dioxygenase subunit beta [Burkholderiaceae bacterium]|nr:aromatic-ring-hydroxylating dioxygenase subunit beta [Burkholderiaceae bacterium]
MTTTAPTSGKPAIPSAGADMRHLLDQEVVIDGVPTVAPTGAMAVEPSHSPRAPLTGAASGTRVLPRPGLRPAAGTGADLQREVEQLLYLQAELLDGKHWQAWMDLFAPEGLYWMPVAPEQTEWESSPSIFIEDKLLMEIRKGRIVHPNAWSQAPQWETSHLVSHVSLEAVDGDTIEVRSRFHMMELRRDAIRHFGGSYRHTLQRGADGVLRIRLQRVDLFNSQAAFDYVLQIWV